MLEPFTEAYLVHDVPVYDESTTLYTRWGDWLGVLSAAAAAALLVAGFAILLVARSKKAGE
jgi:apolipoprotein N-acyltransferase